MLGCGIDFIHLHIDATQDVMNVRNQLGLLVLPQRLVLGMSFKSPSYVLAASAE